MLSPSARGQIYNGNFALELQMSTELDLQDLQLDKDFLMLSKMDTNYQLLTNTGGDKIN